MITLAAAAFVVGAIFGSAHHGSAQQTIAEQFARAWARKDYSAMYDDIDEEIGRAHV